MELIETKLMKVREGIWPECTGYYTIRLSQKWG